MIETTIRMKIGSKQQRDLIRCLEQGRKWSHGFNWWDVTDIKRIERTDFVRVLLTRKEEKYAV
jgi:hypothetical protein